MLTGSLTDGAGEASCHAGFERRRIRPSQPGWAAFGDGSRGPNRPSHHGLAQFLLKHPPFRTTTLAGRLTQGRIGNSWRILASISCLHTGSQANWFNYACVDKMPVNRSPMCLAGNSPSTYLLVSLLPLATTGNAIGSVGVLFQIGRSILSWRSMRR